MSWPFGRSVNDGIEFACYLGELFGLALLAIWAAVLAINSGRTKCSFTSACLRELWLVCSTNDIELRAVHIPGVDNRQADWLSRWHIDLKFRDLFINSVNDSFLEISFDFEFLKIKHLF